jgi:hypothetical protein
MKCAVLTMNIMAAGLIIGLVQASGLHVWAIEMFLFSAIFATLIYVTSKIWYTGKPKPKHHR